MLPFLSPAVRALTIVTALAQAVAAQHGRIVTDTLRSASLTNLLGAPAQARVSVYLPPSYDASPLARYPVLYLLHGLFSSDAEWTRVAPDRGMRGRDIRGMMDSLIVAGAARDMIIVMPDASNALGGTFYVNSGTTGLWEDFMTHDLVAHVDRTYRTLATPASRGIAGVSMGGFGTFYLGMRHGGDIYGAMYAVSSCCTPAHFNPAATPAVWDTIAATPSLDSLRHMGPLVRVMAALSAAFAPSANKPPFFFDPEERRDGKIRVNDSVQMKWDAHSPMLMLPGSRARLLRMRGIAFDIGAQDEAVPPRDIISMDSAFTLASIPHTFELFEGTHTNRITERLATKVLPFFSRSLVFEAKP
jgi:S-formylglutathione hydrolase